MTPRILLAAVFISLSGCATTQNLVGTPDVTLKSVELENVSFRSQTFLLGFEVVNPNPFPLPVEAIRYNVSLDNERFAGGETQASFTIPANGSNGFVVSVELDILNRATQITSLLQGGVPDNVSYQVDGSLSVDIPFTRPLTFSSSGMIAVAH
jgi:LEA14-like dessication related protein